MRQRPPSGKVCGEASAGSRAGAARPSAASAGSPGAAGRRGRRRRSSQAVLRVRYVGRGSRLESCRAVGYAGTGAVRSPRTGTVEASSGPQQHLARPSDHRPDQLDGLRRTRSSGSSCVTSGSGSSSPAPKTRTVCAQASGGAPNTVCTSSCRTTRSVGSRPSAPGAGMPGEDQPAAAPQQGGGGAGGGGGPGGLDDDVEVVGDVSLVPGAEVGGAEGLRQLRPVGPGPDHEQLGGGARLQELDGEHPERPGADHGDPLARAGRSP